ncbi:MAG: OST5 family protein [Bacteroidia bacterium]|nr:OST5 family protein [Bacteroidia bacterium]
MNEYKDRLKDISEIRNLMEESSRFMSLSGLSGVGAGVVALVGAAGTYHYLHGHDMYSNIVRMIRGKPYLTTIEQLLALVGIALLILICAIGVATFFTVRNAKRQGKKIWTHSTQRMMINLFIPLVAGAVFCVQLAWYGFAALVAPATLVFYGMALLNAGKYTYREIRYLGISEIILGLIAASFLGYGIVFWALGFGVLHIVYGTVMYLKYER